VFGGQHYKEILIMVAALLWAKKMKVFLRGLHKISKQYEVGLDTNWPLALGPSKQQQNNTKIQFLLSRRKSPSSLYR
jgi:hypothetical protein